MVEQKEREKEPPRKLSKGDKPAMMAEFKFSQAPSSDPPKLLDPCHSTATDQAKHPPPLLPTSPYPPSPPDRNASMAEVGSRLVELLLTNRVVEFRPTKLLPLEQLNPPEPPDSCPR